VENEVFRALLLCLYTALEVYLPSSGYTIKNWLLEEFKRKKSILKEELRISKSLIYLTFNGWTSLNKLGFLDVVVYYISLNGEIKASLLDLRQLKGTHSGENIVKIMRTLIYEYEIENRIGYFVLNNISSNNTCVRELLPYIKPNISSKHRRLRYFGHIINLAVKVFLWGSDFELFKIEAKLFKKLE